MESYKKRGEGLPLLRHNVSRHPPPISSSVTSANLLQINDSQLGRALRRLVSVQEYECGVRESLELESSQVNVGILLVAEQSTLHEIGVTYEERDYSRRQVSSKEKYSCLL